MKIPPAALPRVLVVEPDPARAAALEQMLRPSFTFELEIALNADEAIRSMRRALPYLVMTSMLLSPADAALITAYVRQLTPGWRLPIVDLPYALGRQLATASAPRPVVPGLGSWLRRSAAPPRGEAPTLRQHIEEYLHHARVEPLPLYDRYESLSAPSSGELCLVSVSPGPAPGAALQRAASSVLAQRADRRRAQRRRLEDLPARWQLTVSGAPDVDIVNISTTGVLLETGMQIVPGTILDVQLLARDQFLNVPARMLRSEPVRAEARTARYRVAAAFARELGILEAGPRLAPSDAESIADVLRRVSDAIDRAFDPIPVGASF